MGKMTSLTEFYFLKDMICVDLGDGHSQDPIPPHEPTHGSYRCSAAGATSFVGDWESLWTNQGGQFPTTLEAVDVEI